MLFTCVKTICIPDVCLSTDMYPYAPVNVGVLQCYVVLDLLSLCLMLAQTALPLMDIHLDAAKMSLGCDRANSEGHRRLGAGWGGARPVKATAATAAEGHR